MIFNQTEKQEKEYLQQVITTIHDTINTTSTSVKEHIDTLQEYKDYLWSNKDIDPHEIRSMRESILNHFALGENVIDKRRRLSKILDIPYFGRIDFQEKKDKSQVSPIYIGIHTFYDLNQKKNLIYDWRAPISSMFYDHELGEAFYSSPAGKINGTISLKRQYRIRKGKMEYMIESSVTVHDDILQKELCSNADNKMKNIVTTIQREQNQIIRNENASVLIIQGVAGSGGADRGGGGHSRAGLARLDSRGGAPDAAQRAPGAGQPAGHPALHGRVLCAGQIGAGGGQGQLRHAGQFCAAGGAGPQQPPA